MPAITALFCLLVYLKLHILVGRYRVRGFSLQIVYLPTIDFLAHSIFSYGMPSFPLALGITVFCHVASAADGQVCSYFAARCTFAADVFLRVLS